MTVFVELLKRIISKQCKGKILRKTREHFGNNSEEDFKQIL